MSIRTILHYPDKRLRITGKPVKEFGPELHQLLDDMAETMYAAPGVGLAAPQLGVAQRIFIIDIATGEDEASELRVFINPEIVETQGSVVWEEGCLSFPSVHEDVDRAEWVKVRAFDKDGQEFELEADGLLAIAIQHENDHLDGKLMIDHLSLLKRRLVHRAMAKRAASDRAAE
ncbi:MAG: peptide deformylase [Deltaproteobacteria bacterium]|nr:MAG: peptide deformylase [Deltaproteobacteria bacterium]